MRIAISAVVLLVTLIGITVYMAQAIQPEIETTVEIIPSEKVPNHAYKNVNGINFNSIQRPQISFALFCQHFLCRINKEQ